MAQKQVDNLEQMQMDLKHAIRDYYLTENKESILTIQELSTKMAILHNVINLKMNPRHFLVCGFIFYDF